MNKMQMVRVSSVEREGEGICTIRFPLDRQVKPGQFFMVWIPGVDEIPMSASFVYGEKGITVREVGQATKALCSLKAGARIGIRGPYGNGYDVAPCRALLIAGGTGTASLLPVAEFIADQKQVDVLIGARKKSELIFMERARKLSWE
ncbi:MAG TPA: dihydroorotate dehydrogenase electron transfer subunit, partial [Methanomassiliicoccales archaeon]|nr:dihydroorotate dehydrogenase electron transfer subunit [Methanomassiliicoccales archaeon]